MAAPPSLYYVLDDDGCPIPADRDTWSDMCRERFPVVGATNLTPEVWVSTVFFGTNIRLVDEPALWETMVFGFEGEAYQQRYTSQEAAVAGHEAAVQWARTQLEQGRPVRAAPDSDLPSEGITSPVTS